MNEDNEEKVVRDKKLGKLILIINLVLLIPLMGILSFNFVSKNIRKSNEEVNKVVNKEVYKEAEEILVEINTTKSDEEKGQIVRDYDFVHQMSNNLIIAIDGKIRGNQDVTLENIDLGIEMLKNDSYIVAELIKWKEGNFENAVEVHNYCWVILEGDEGKAEGISEEGVNAAKKAIGKEEL